MVCFEAIYKAGMHLLLIIRLEARIPTNIGFIFEDALKVFTHSDITSPKVNRFGWNLEHSEYVVCAARDLCSSESWRARRIFLSGK